MTIARAHPWTEVAIGAWKLLTRTLCRIFGLNVEEVYITCAF